MKEKRNSSFQNQATSEVVQFNPEFLNEIALANIDDIFSLLNLDGIKENGNEKFFGRCPIHRGDNPNSFVLYKDSGIWRCFTRNCHTKYAGLLGLLQGILGSFPAVENLVKSFADGSEISLSEVEKNRFTRLFQKKGKIYDNPLSDLSRQIVRSRLVIPAQIFIDRGFSAEILNAYDVGLCVTKGKEMSGRVVCPIYDAAGVYVGCSGRSILKECPKCKLYHDLQQENCPKSYLHHYSKWRHSSEFRPSEHLFNISRCLNSRIIYITEGILDCLRLVECGLSAVAIFGTNFTNNQFQLLTKTKAIKLVICLDNDKAGKRGALYIKKICEKLYNVEVKFPPQGKKDVGSMSNEEIKEWLNVEKL